MKTLLFALLLFVPTAALCQNAKIDSLKRVIETTKVDTVKGRTLCRLCGELHKGGKYKEGLSAGQRGLEISQKAQDRKWQGICLDELGTIYLGLSDYPRAIQYYQSSLQVFQTLGKKASAAIELNNLSVVYQRQGDLSRSLDCSLRSIRLWEQLGNAEGIADGYSNVAVIYQLRGDLSRALHYHERSLKIRERNGYRNGIAISLLNMGSIYHTQRKFAQGLDCCLRSLEIFKELGDLQNLAVCLDNIGNIYYHQKQNQLALDYFRQGYRISSQLGDRAGQARSMILIGWVFESQNQLDSVRYYALKGLKMGQLAGDLVAQRHSSKTLYEVDSALGNWKGAFEAARLYHICSDSLKNDAQSQELGRLESKAEYDKQAEIDRLKNEEDKRRERERFAWMLGSAGGGLLLLLVIAFTLFRGRQKEKKANAALRTLNEEINQQKAEIEAINAELQATLREVNEQKHEIEEQHAKIEDSIRYASRIQHAILPSEAQLQECMPPHFIHYQPRDIVSGDFYWMTKHQDKTFFATVDCTGHGVPGAFMSVLGSNLLHQIVDENQITEPDVILAELDRRIAATLRQQFGGDSKDGMDLALVVLHEADKNGTRTVEFAGAGRPLWHWSNGEITEYKSAKYSCGGRQHEGKTYPAHRIDVNSGDRLYVFSDGPVDQFGGPNGRKLGSTQLQSFLSETANLPIDEQGKRFGAFFNDWMKAKKQLDDVLLAGIAL